MKRIEGYINLNEILQIDEDPAYSTVEELLNFIQRNNSSVIVQKAIGNRQFIFSFDYNNKKYYFKFDSRVSPYNELIAEEICKDLDLPCINYDLARLFNFDGVISENYKTKNAEYISGNNILKSCYGNNFQHNFLKENTLYGIWHALEFRYKNRRNMQEIVSHLMKKIVQMYLFDILTGQTDRHADNWEVIEYDDGRVDLQPIFDNGRMMLTDPCITTVLMKIDNNDLGFLDDSINTFQKISSREFFNIFPSWLWVISEKNIENIFKRIEEKTKAVIPNEIKEEFLLKFKIYREFMEEELESLNYNREGR